MRKHVCSSVIYHQVCRDKIDTRYLSCMSCNNLSLVMYGTVSDSCCSFSLSFPSFACCKLTSPDQCVKVRNPSPIDLIIPSKQPWPRLLAFLYLRSGHGQWTSQNCGSCLSRLEEVSIPAGEDQRGERKCRAPPLTHQIRWVLAQEDSVHELVVNVDTETWRCEA